MSCESLLTVFKVMNLMSGHGFLHYQVFYYCTENFPFSLSRTDLKDLKLNGAQCKLYLSAVMPPERLVFLNDRNN